MNSIDVQERALQLPVDQLAAARARLEGVFADARGTRRDMRPLIEAQTRELVALVEHDLEELRAQAERRLRGLVRDFLSSSTDVRREGGRLRELIEDALRIEVDRWRSQEDRRVGAGFRDIAARFEESTDAAARETIRLSGEILGIDLAATTTAGDLTTDTRFTYSFFEVPTIVESLLPDVRRLLPSRTARKLLEREARARIHEIVDRHCGRLRWDFVQRIERSRLELERALDARLDATIDALTRGIERADLERASSETEVARARARSQEWRCRLQALRSRFAEVAPEEGS
jgi:hypothetical protein